MTGGTRAPLAVPLSFDSRGRTTEALPEAHLRDLIENVLFTSPGERVMRPTFGSGLLQLVFAPNSDQLVATVRMLVAGALQQWLGDVIEVAGLAIAHEDGTLTVSVDYVVRTTGETANATFVRTV